MLGTPIKQGARITVGMGQRDLKNLKEVFQCESQGFGKRPEVYGPGGHNGLDFVYNEGTEVYAMHDGLAYYKEESSGYGKYFTVVGSGYKTVYAHLKERVAKDGSVKRGDLLGYGNSSGFSTGNHLHITVKRVDANGNVLDRDNGHDGAIDPTEILAYQMFQLRQVSGSKDVWLVRDGKRSLVYNSKALELISDFSDIKPITESDLKLIPDTGKVIATLDQE